MSAAGLGGWERRRGELFTWSVRFAFFLVGADALARRRRRGSSSTARVVLLVVARQPPRAPDPARRRTRPATRRASP